MNKASQDQARQAQELVQDLLERGQAASEKLLENLERELRAQIAMLRKDMEQIEKRLTASGRAVQSVPTRHRLGPPRRPPAEEGATAKKAPAKKKAAAKKAPAGRPPEEGGGQEGAGRRRPRPRRRPRELDT